MTCPNCGNEVADFMKFCQKCGTPMTAAPYSAPAQQAGQQTWSPAPQFGGVPPKRKSRAGKILLIVGLVLFVLIAGIGTAIFFGARSYMRSMRSSAPYALAESALRESPAVKERLGQIKNIGMPFGTYKEDADGSGFAVFTMSVEGEKASGQYTASMERHRSVWGIQRAVMQLPGGEVINVAGGPGATNSDPLSGVDNGNQNSAGSSPANANGKSKTISGGTLTGKAISLPQPVYPPSAKAARAEGTVVVQVTVDEDGKVSSARAVSGHPLLKASAEAAARQAVFTPTMLAGQPVKVTGVINYNFKLE